MIRYWKVTAIDEHGEEVTWTMHNILNHEQSRRLAFQECEANGYQFKSIEQFR